MKLGELKSNQKYFARQNRKSWKPQKINATVRLLFSKCAHSWRGFSEGILRVVLFIVLRLNWSVQKHCVAKVLLAIWEIFLHENSQNHNSYRFSYRFTFILFLSFLTNQKIRVLACWRSGNKKYFCFLFIARHTLFQSHAEFNRLYKRIFSNVISVHIIVLCFRLKNLLRIRPKSTKLWLIWKPIDTRVYFGWSKSLILMPTKTKNIHRKNFPLKMVFFNTKIGWWVRHFQRGKRKPKRFFTSWKLWCFQIVSDTCPDVKIWLGNYKTSKKTDWFLKMV